MSGSVPMLRVTPTTLGNEDLSIGKIESWFKKYKRIATFYGWNASTSASYLPLFLDGRVSDAFDSILKDSRDDIDKIKAHLVNKLLTTDPYDAFHKRILQPNESFRDFGSDLLRLADRMLGKNGDSVSPSVLDGLARAQFLSGLPNETADKLRLVQLGSLEELIQRAETISAVCGSNEDQQQAFYVNYRPRSYGKGKGYAGKGSYGKGFSSGKGKGYYGKGFQQETRSFGKGSRPVQQDRFWFNRCYSCGELGHLARDCTAQPLAHAALIEENEEDFHAQPNASEQGN